MLWEWFFDNQAVNMLTWEHYHAGLRSAIQSINAELKKPYEHAVAHREQEYEDVVCTADGDELFLSLKEIYGAYRVIIGKRDNRVELDRTKYADCVRKLKTKAFGSILEQVSNRPGWYVYKEKMLRGYVRMQAEANGVALSGERLAPRQQMHEPANARTGYFGSTPPRGIRERRNEDDSEKG